MGDNSAVAFHSVMLDITGKLSLEGEDPRWSQLFRCKKAFLYKGDEPDFLEFSSRLQENNLLTGNFHMLLEQTVSRLHQMLVKKTRPSKSIIEQCCAALHISSLFFLYFTSHVNANMVMYPYYF